MVGIRQKATLPIPGEVAYEALIRVTVGPSSGAVLLYNSIMGDEPIRFDGPFLIGHIPTDSAEIEFELIEGAKGCRIETIGWRDDLDGTKHAERAKLKTKGKTGFSAPIIGERERFYAAIGFAVSQWQHVEAALANIFVSLVAANAGAAANAAFFAAINFNIKLDMVGAAAQQQLSQNSADILKQWQELYSVCRQKANIRNRFSHFISAIHVVERNKYQYYLEESILDWNNFGKTGSPKYNFLNIENEAHAFGSLAEKLIQFVAGLA